MYVDLVSHDMVRFGHNDVTNSGFQKHSTTLLSQIVEHTEINEHVGEIAENLIVEHLFYTISIATNNRTPGIFFNCVNSQTCLTIRDTRVEQLECLRSEIPSAAPWLPILVIHNFTSDHKSKQDKVKVTNFKNCQKFKFWHFARNFTGDTPSQVAW